MNYQYESLDFDRLAELARTKPQVLERYLRLKVNQIIARASSEERNRLRQLQFRIDSVRHRTKTPLAACIKISQMMQDELWCLRQALSSGANSASHSSSTNVSASTDSRRRFRGKVVPMTRSGKFKA